MIQGNLSLWGVSLWESLFVVSQKWSFPTTLDRLNVFVVGLSACRALCVRQMILSGSYVAVAVATTAMGAATRLAPRF